MAGLEDGLGRDNLTTTAATITTLTNTTGNVTTSNTTTDNIINANITTLTVTGGAMSLEPTGVLPTKELTTTAGAITVIVGGDTRYIQLYS